MSKASPRKKAHRFLLQIDTRRNEPQIVKKHQTHVSDEIEAKILSMYGLGMSYSDIAGHVEEMYGISVSTATISTITDKLKVGMELRNGDPDDPVSNNTSFDGGFQAKDFNLAQAYVDIKATDSIDVIAGKFAAKKRWTVSDFQWDDDVTVEAVASNIVACAVEAPIVQIAATRATTACI